MLGLFIFMFVRPIFCVSLQIISLFNNVPVDKKKVGHRKCFRITE
ncbi:unnamed protein product [Brassica oleracea var. botrytis]|uniref:(rape) hypothetical protein n=1 Tax=Brassica napus TaxID=3708 RepID=A0A816IUK5_BRANA|nr:unnamed protein product [Brassica napus]